MELIHGGDWAGFETEYGRLPLDFSANVSPLGLPERVRKAAAESLDRADRYPDPACRELRRELGAFYSADPERIVCGNGASDLIDRICRALRPKKAALFVPCFAEYERALSAARCEITFLPLSEAEDFRLPDDAAERIPRDCGLLFLCNPNNPSGLTVGRNAMNGILARCAETGMRLVADECFLDFTDRPDEHSLIGLPETRPEIVVLRAFTKTWGMAGLRLGWALCGDRETAGALERCGPPWQVSSVAQAAGAAALQEREYVGELRRLVSAERRRMIDSLLALGLRVIPGEANFLLFRSGDALLAEKLRRRGILIRDCGNFRGLGEGWFRTAVRTAEENGVLLRTLREVLTDG